MRNRNNSSIFCRNVVKVTGEDIIVKEPKTAAGDRYVYFSLEMASLLKEYRSFCQGELELHEGRSLTSEDYIFRRLGLSFANCNQYLVDSTGGLKEEYTIEGMHIYGDGYAMVLKALLPLLQAAAAQL